ncbi:MAG TPA: hypothetical protein VGQ31_11370 [Candidatus Limnocylindrales bacterium]|jgi:hypothetical protein|nr:hypothetical protein [Candidatus Limnocylindrales bacterium]
MEEPAVREHAEAFCAALVAGDVGHATEHFSQELQRNLGEVVALLPLPAVAATVDSIERAGAGFTVILQLTGESEVVRLQTRWKERDGGPTLIELSHLSKTEVPASAAEEDDAEEGPTA